MGRLSLRFDDAIFFIQTQLSSVNLLFLDVYKYQSTIKLLSLPCSFIHAIHPLIPLNLVALHQIWIEVDRLLIDQILYVYFSE